jgi:hypothetical protein
VCTGSGVSADLLALQKQLQAADGRWCHARGYPSGWQATSAAARKPGKIFKFSAIEQIFFDI